MGVSGNTCAASCKISYMAGVDSILWVFFVRSHVTPPFYVLETLYVSAFALLECISAKCISSRTRHNIYLYFPESHLLPGRQCEGVLRARGRRKLSGWRQATWDLFVWPLFWGLGCKFRPRASHPVYEWKHAPPDAPAARGAPRSLYCGRLIAISHACFGFFSPAVLSFSEALEHKWPRHHGTKKRAGLFCAGAWSTKNTAPQTLKTPWFFVHREILLFKMILTMHIGLKENSDLILISKKMKNHWNKALFIKQITSIL